MSRQDDVTAFLRDRSRVQFAKPLDDETYERLCSRYVRSERHPTARRLAMADCHTSGPAAYLGPIDGSSLLAPRVGCPKCNRPVALAKWWEILAGNGCAAHGGRHQ